MKLVVGDIHGEFAKLNKIINRRRDSIDMILQCGDWGYWPKFHGTTYVDRITGKVKIENNYNVKNGKTKIYFCDGNHEDHESLNKLESNEIIPNIFYMKRGTTLTLDDGRVVLFIGGASSIDKEFRTPGYDWFPEEAITQQDIYNLPDMKIDIVISHTCPREFYNKLKFRNNFVSLKVNDPSMDALSYVLNKYKPPLWYFAHFHLFKQGYDSNCRWTALSYIGSSERCWIELRK
jgi:Icc-related predicted phosphoesterase